MSEFIRRLGFVLILNQYQGGMFISGVLKTISRTPRRLISPLRHNWGRPTVRHSDMYISPWLWFRVDSLQFLNRPVWQVG